MSRTILRLVMVVLAALLALSPALAQAQEPEGPGYGGGADKLNVQWTSNSAVAAAAAAADNTRSKPAAPKNTSEVGTNPDILRAGAQTEQLSINGVGFGTRSEVEIAVGDTERVAVRADSTGSLQLSLDNAESAKAEPGVSVLALGRSPSGSTRTLVGAVPPKPGGTGPAELLPWLVAAAVVAGAGFWLVRRVGR